MQKLEKRIQDLELDLYHERLPDIRYVMKRFNLKDVNCHCVQCQREGRYPHLGAIGMLWPGDFCTFIPAWDAYLYEMGAGVDEVCKAGLVNIFSNNSPKFATTPAALWTCNYEWTMPVRWVSDYGWGKPLSSLSSPRKKVWDELVEHDSFVGSTVY